MGLLDLSTSATSKKHVDFNDARYQSADKLKQSGKKNVRSTFTLYDNKEANKIAVQEISAAYALSDKRMPMGELLNKMVDLIIDMDDGVLNAEKDAIYAWKYSVAILNMYDDKCKRQETLSVFDNGLKNAVVASETFRKRFPGEYTTRTNFFDQKVKTKFAADIVDTFKNVALPRIHDIAIEQSHEIAEQHNNPILDKIVNWAVETYKCEVDSYFDIQKDENTNLYFSVNTIILHLKNGYDMSIIGHVGTDHDDKFAIAILNANEVSLEKHGSRVDQKDVDVALATASGYDPIDPITQLLTVEKKRNEILKEQYQILSEIRPMIPQSVLDIKAAESVVGADYIWGCKQYRMNHEDLPVDFKLSDVKLPEIAANEDQEKEIERQQKLIEDMEKIADSMDAIKGDEKKVEETIRTVATGVEEKEESISEFSPLLPSKNQDEEEKREDKIVEISQPEIESEEAEEIVGINEIARATLEPAPAVQPAPMQPMEIEDLFADLTPSNNTFANTPRREEKVFGDPSRTEFTMPLLANNIQRTSYVENESASEMKTEKEFDPTAILLPGFTPIKKSAPVETGPSITKQAQQAPVLESTPMLNVDPKPVEEKVKVDEPKREPAKTITQPSLMFDDIDSLFA